MIKHQRTGAGFTLIEIMVALAILSIGLVGIITAFLTSLNALKNTENYNQAVLVSLEQLWQVEDEILRLGEGANPSKYSGELVEGIRHFNWEFTEVPLNDYPDLKEIQLIMTWSEGKRKGGINWTTYLSIMSNEE